MIGILAVQGGVEEHENILNALGLAHKRVKGLKDVEVTEAGASLSGFIIPGGESTVMDQFMNKYGLKDWLIQKVKQDPSFVVFGTCAGLILLARYGLLDVTVERNAYGRQHASFEAEVLVEGAGLEGYGDLVSSHQVIPVRGHFIRAPKVTHVGVLAQVLAEHAGVPVVLKQGRVWGISFHPELAGSSRLHSAVFSC